VKWRFIDDLAPVLPSDIDVPAALVEAAEHAAARRAGLEGAAGELNTAHRQLELAVEDDRVAEVKAAHEGAPSPKGRRAKAAEQVAQAERAVGAHMETTKAATRNYLDAVWDAAPQLQADIADIREQTRAETLEAVRHIGLLFDKIGSLDELARNLQSLQESGGMVAGWQLVSNPENVHVRRQLREELFARALQPGNQWRRPDDVVDCLCEIVKHLQPPEPPVVETIDHGAYGDSPFAALAAAQSDQGSLGGWK
jgi:hypothetical protein